MHRSQKKKVYECEDLSLLVENIPEDLHAPITALSYAIFTHDAYNNLNYKWKREDFELGTPLGKGRIIVRGAKRQL